jgi:indole-3-glycerol phosphate synthase
MNKPSNTTRGEAFLGDMARDSKSRASAARARLSERELIRQALDMPAPKSLDFRGQGFDLIAEVKFRSPGLKHEVERRGDPQTAQQLAASYAHGGAAMVSVLTQPSSFGGSLEFLRRVAQGSSIPVMRKDFLVDTYQIWEARAAGADCVLLVIRILDDNKFTELLDACLQAGLVALLEAFDARDLRRAKRLLAGYSSKHVLLGINNRDLSNLQIDRGRSLRMHSELPKGFPAVAESGLESPAHAAQVAAAGFRLALVGHALMRSPDPQALIRSMLQAARALMEPTA